jgi:hypothetical protein
MQRLAEAKAGATPTRFASDGCSAGMSALWSLVAEDVPPFAERFGDRPPWEHCCVSHDWLYWRGATEDGYAARAAADEALRACVTASARALDPGVLGAAPLAGADLEALFARVADLMHAAVRAGGMPCSGLPWRWGYGWPHCALP